MAQRKGGKKKKKKPNTYQYPHKNKTQKKRIEQQNQQTPFNWVSFAIPRFRWRDLFRAIKNPFLEEGPRFGNGCGTQSSFRFYFADRMGALRLCVGDKWGGEVGSGEKGNRRILRGSKEPLFSIMPAWKSVAFGGGEAR